MERKPSDGEVGSEERADVSVLLNRAIGGDSVLGAGRTNSWRLEEVLVRRTVMQTGWPFFGVDDGGVGSSPPSPPSEVQGSRNGLLEGSSSEP